MRLTGVERTLYIALMQDPRHEFQNIRQRKISHLVLSSLAEVIAAMRGAKRKPERDVVVVVSVNMVDV